MDPSDVTKIYNHLLGFLHINSKHTGHYACILVKPNGEESGLINNITHLIETRSLEYFYLFILGLTKSPVQPFHVFVFFHKGK